MLSFCRIAACAAVLTACWSATASAQVVGREGDHFTYNGLPRFLVFVSYFDGLRASDSTLDSDFAYLESKGIDGVRVMANWWVGGIGDPPQYGYDTLVDGSGGVNDTTYNRLRTLLNKADQHHLVVDLTFTFDTVPGGSRDSEIAGIRTVNSRLSADGYWSTLIDVQNEWPKWFTSSQVVELRYAVGGRPATASTKGGYDLGATIAAASEQALDLIAYHERRDYGWWNDTYGVVQTLRTSGRPVYLQEPAKYTDTPGITADNFITAVANAKAAGAAAWTFHTLAAKDLNGQSMTSNLAGIEVDFLNRFRSYVDATAWGIQATPYRSVNLQSWNGPYMVAEGGGGDAVNADRPNAGPWETFTMHDLNGGELQDGDGVTFLTDNQAYLQAAWGGYCGWSLMRAVGGGEGPWETFAIVNLSRPGRVIGSGDRVGLRSEQGAYAMATNGGGDGSTVVFSCAVGPWETWTLIVRW
jgi:hypothetical protein